MTLRAALQSPPLPHGPACGCCYLPALSDEPLPVPEKRAPASTPLLRDLLDL